MDRGDKFSIMQQCWLMGYINLIYKDQGCQYTSRTFTSLFEERDGFGNLKTRISYNNYINSYVDLTKDQSWG